MSLFQFGFSISSTRQQTPHAPENIALAASHLPDKEDTILGRNEYNQVAAAVVDLARPQPSQSRSKRSKYLQYSGEDRAKIAKYSCEHGNTKALQHFSKEYPNLKESTLRNFKKAYQDKLKVIQRQEGNVQQVTSLESLPRGRPPLLLELDCKLISFVINLRARGGVVNGSVISAAAKGLIRSNPSLHQRYNSFEPTRGWIQSIYRRCNFSRRAGTTTRPPVPRGMYEECKRSFLTDIDKCINKHNIPPELVLDADQTPSSYVSVGRMTMAEKNSKSVPIKGLTDKRNITLTFAISLAGEFLPMQVIYQGKTKASLPRNFVFPKGFCLTQNPKHYSNEEETLKLIDSIINPYLVQTRQQLKLPPTQKAILIWDVFRGQTTERVLSKLASLNIEIVSVPANMTHFFQPLDLTVNGQAKKFCKEKFTTWYSQEVQRQLDSGTSFEDIEVDFRMSVIKPLLAGWLVALYDYLTGAEGRRCIFKGWEKAGVKEIVNSDKPLPPVDPFEEIYQA